MTHMPIDGRSWCNEQGEHHWFGRAHGAEVHPHKCCKHAGHVEEAMQQRDSLRKRMEDLVRSMDRRIVDYNGEATVKWITDDIMAVVEGAAVDSVLGPHSPGCDGDCNKGGSMTCFP